MEIKEYLTTINFKKSENRNIQYIVIHYVGAVSTALNNAEYFHSTYRGASAHYFVDENDIYRVVQDEDTAWHCGTNGEYFSNARNENSIGIEMCCYSNNGIIDISENVIKRTIELVKELMEKYNISKENIVRHYDVTRKDCPAPLVNDEKRWEEFKNMLELPDLQCRAHLQNIGWTEYIDASELIGTAGEERRIEAIQFIANNGLEIQYRVHVENIGWQEWKQNGEVAGTEGQSLRIEAIEIKCNKDLEVQEHIQDVGWMPVSKGKEIFIGTIGKSLRLEAFKINVLN